MYIYKNSKIQKIYLFEMIMKIYLAKDLEPDEIETFGLCSELLDVYMDFSYIYEEQNINENEKNIIYSKSTLENKSFNNFNEEKGLYNILIKLSNENILYMKQIEQGLSIICVIKGNSIEKKNILDYNLDKFKDSLFEILSTNNIKI